jgi:hypothetical protein
MSETMVLALEEHRAHYTLGRGIDLAKVREIGALAARAGFALGGMRAFDKAVTPEDVAATKRAASERRAAAVL